jgi:Holliday junction resolvase RusA-like endonuclease
VRRVTLFAPESLVVPDAHELPAITITVFGLPAPQGSKKAFRNQHTGRIQLTESSAKVKPWRSDVKAAALVAVAELTDWVPLDGPLAASMTFTFARPRGHFGTGRNAGFVKASAPVRPHTKPDLSKLVRSTEDALTGLVWADDARVVEYRRLGKHYASSGDIDVLTMPGAVIRVWQLPSEGSR